MGQTEARTDGQEAGMLDTLEAAVARIAPSHRHLVLTLALELGERHPNEPTQRRASLRLVQNG